MPVLSSHTLSAVTVRPVHHLIILWHWRSLSLSLSLILSISLFLSLTWIEFLPLRVSYSQIHVELKPKPLCALTEHISTSSPATRERESDSVYFVTGVPLSVIDWFVAHMANHFPSGPTL